MVLISNKKMLDMSIFLYINIYEKSLFLNAGIVFRVNNYIGTVIKRL